MSNAESGGITLDELRQTLRAVDPRVTIVPSRVLRRVVRGVAGQARHGWHVPHRGAYTASGGAVLAHAERDEVGLGPDEPVPDSLILLAEPDLDRLEDLPRRDVLVRYWRGIFHARVHLAYEGAAEQPAPRIDRLGGVEFAEARAVLAEDGYLSLPADDRATYVEFAAVYLELAAFRPDLLTTTFPAIGEHERVGAMLRDEVDADALFEATRPAGAPTNPLTERSDDEPGDEPEADTDGEAALPEPRIWGRLKAWAASASARGNNVRAAILKVRAAGRAPLIERPRTLASARSELDTLSRRLREALGFDAEQAARWRRALPPLLRPAATGLWPREARLLYDLQKVCIDHERPIYTLDLGGWIVTLGRRPLKRVLPDHREVVMLKHLRAAERRLARLSGGPAPKAVLAGLLGTAIHQKESEIRGRFRDRIRDDLDRVGLCPANLPERAARRKLVEELLDLIVERGFFRIGDLRDAISRNQMKLPDLSGPREFFRGDPLLLADRELARDLDGVYQHGEIYLRALQRGSSLAFGTRIGRALSLRLALPMVGAFVALEGLQHIVGPIVHASGGVEPELFNPLSFVSLGLLLLGVINVPRFRAGFFRACRAIGSVLRAVFFDAPRWVLDRPAIRAVVRSRAFTLIWNWIGKPALILGGIGLIADEPLPAGWTGWLIRGAAFALIAFFINSRSGRDVEEIAADNAARAGRRIWRDVLPNAFRGVMDFFAAGLELVERLIYAVDEWLRFRGGEGRLSLGVKAVLGLVWFAVAYLVRIYINLLIEPQINPIKHFPVVTVSHKMMLPMLPQVLRVVRTVLAPLGPRLAEAIAWPTLFLLPGVFGFIAWELKENWRLYAANRSATLSPVPIGHHGETMSRFLRRGFHSGTVPKLFARLRKAERRAEEGRAGGKAEKARHAIEHVEAAVRHLFERCVGYLLDESRSIGGCRPRIVAIACATNRIVIEIRDAEGHHPTASLAFEEIGGRLRVCIHRAGWLAAIDDEPRRVIASALAGLYAMSDVDLAAHPTAGPAIDLRAAPVFWSDWVETWEGDAAGRGHRPVVVDALRLLPERSLSATSPS